MIGKFLLMFLFSSILLVTNGQRIPEGLYVSCANAVVRQSCSAALDLAFAEGRIRRFTTARQYIQTKGCKLSWWVRETRSKIQTFDDNHSWISCISFSFLFFILGRHWYTSYRSKRSTSGSTSANRRLLHRKRCFRHKSYQSSR
ncbi:hypothetical protein BY996DRAFT_7375825 [Phakopsora pachyrhizi]|nr:hypothetical protein BY996DRAFT_7375825 [Phakopsora pachyrhizi]